jgi:hypothetical protein
VSGFAKDEPAAESVTADPVASADQAETVEAVVFDAAMGEMFEYVFGVIGFLQYVYDFDQDFITNQKDAFQHMFGYNEVYDTFAWVANVYADTIHGVFQYDGREWLLQVWKGAYGMFLAVGGEIGLYSKPIDREIDHYDSVDQPDWIKMEMSVYYQDELQFTKPFDEYWWCTGFKVKYFPNHLTWPHNAVTMLAKLEFDNEEMAQLYTEAMEAKGFKNQSDVVYADRDAVSRSGTTVHLVWTDLSD